MVACYGLVEPVLVATGKDGMANFQPHGSAHIILVLDDDSAVRNSLRFTLEVEGFEVRDYSSPTELLQQESLPVLSCLVVDYRMPIMDGLELIARLRERNIATPAILITSHPNDALRKRASAAGVPIVEKPFMGTVLLDRIREVLDRHQTFQA